MMVNNHLTAAPEAPMVTATPTNIGEVLRQLVDEAINKAAAQPDHLSDFFEQVEADANKIVDTVKRIPDNLVDQLEQPPFRPPDWWSLLVFALLRIRDLLDDDRLTVGYRHPAGWSRMVTLNVSESAADPDNTVVATLGIALTDPGVTHGLWLQVLKDFDMALGAGPLRVKLKANGVADWKYTIGAPMTPPGPVARADIGVQWTPWDPGLSPGAGPVGFQIGPLCLQLALASPTDPLYQITLGLGAPDGAAGLDASVDAHKFLGDALSSFIDIAPLHESYTPQLTLTAGGSPQFSLGHRGLG